MIKVFYGDNRIKIEQEIKKYLGDKYEVIEGADLNLHDLPSVFLGATLFEETRKILLKDLSDNKELWNQLINYLDTEHKIAIWEAKVDKRSVVYKSLQKAKVQIEEYKMMDPPETKLVFDIFDTALKDGKKAVEMCEKIENTNDPYMFVGLMISQAIKKYEYRDGTKEKRVLQELSKLDMQMKTTSFSPWTLVKSFLLQVSLW